MACYELKKDHRVEYWETDAAGVVYFANYHRLMDTAMMEFFEALPVSMPLTEYWGGLGSQGYDWVILDNGCRFSDACAFGDTLNIHLWVTKKTNRTVQFACSFRKNGASQEIVRGHLTVCSTRGSGGKPRAAAPLQEVADQITVAPWEEAEGDG